MIHHAPWTILDARDNNAMHAKSGLRVVLKWKIYRPDSVIAAVITLNNLETSSRI
jgi:hypothetical protein